MQLSWKQKRKPTGTAGSGTTRGVFTKRALAKRALAKHALTKRTLTRQGADKRGFIRRVLSMNLLTKWMLLLLATTIFPLFLTQLVTHTLATDIIQRQTRALSRANLQQSANSMRDFFTDYDSIILDIYTDDNYIANLQAVNVWDSNRYDAAKHWIEKNLENLLYVHPDILGIALIGRNGEATFYDTVTMSGQESFCFALGDMRSDPLYREALTARNTVYSEIRTKTDIWNGPRNLFYIAHQLTDFNNTRSGPIGCVMLCLDERAMREVYLPGMESGNSLTFLLGGEGEILSFPQTAHVGLNLFADSGMLQQDAPPADAPVGTVTTGRETAGGLADGAAAEIAEDTAAEMAEDTAAEMADDGPAGARPLEQAVQAYVERFHLLDSSQLEIHHQALREGAFTLVHVQDLAYALREVGNMTRVTVSIVLFFGVICVLASLSFATATEHKVKTIIQAMGQADQGHYDAPLAVGGTDEFAEIAHHFNDMVVRIKHSREQEREALVRQKDAEIRSLEAQINPHFLCNTLDAINWVAIEREQMHISKLLNYLAVILRHSIYHSNESVTMAEELAYLDKYVALQRERFCDAFTYHVDVDPSLMGCRIHKLLMQPLIENTIIHGFPGSTGRDRIDLTIRRQDGAHILIEVRDNGKGMPEEVVEQFNRQQGKVENGLTHLGVRNVMARLRLYYGEDGMFRMASGAWGTSVTLAIPETR